MVATCEIGVSSRSFTVFDRRNSISSSSSNYIYLNVKVQEKIEQRLCICCAFKQPAYFVSVFPSWHLKVKWNFPKLRWYPFSCSHFFFMLPTLAYLIAPFLVSDSKIGCGGRNLNSVKYSKENKNYGPFEYQYYTTLRNKILL